MAPFRARCGSPGRYVHNTKQPKQSMQMSFKQRKQLGRLRRRLREAENRVNKRIIERMKELREDPTIIKELSTVLDDDVVYMRTDMEGWLKRVTSKPAAQHTLEP